MSTVIIIFTSILGGILLYKTREITKTLNRFRVSCTNFMEYFKKTQPQPIDREIVWAQVVPILETILEPLYDINLIRKSYHTLNQFHENQSYYDKHEELMDIKHQLEYRYNSLKLMIKSNSGEMKKDYNERANRLYYKNIYVSDYSNYHANEVSHLIDEIQRVLV
jgi:hypothetical protein